MKGKLKYTDKGWFIEYIAEPAGENVWIETLPVSVVDVSTGNLHHDKEVEFKKVIAPFDVNGINDVQYCAQIINESKTLISRLEVIDNKTGRLFTKYFKGSIKIEYQDEGKTLKIFIKDES